MGVVRFCIGAFFLAVIFKSSNGLYEHNPFLSKVTPSNASHPAQSSDLPEHLKPNVPPSAIVLPPTNDHQVGSSHSNTNQPGPIILNVPSYILQAPHNFPSVPITQSPLSAVLPPFEPLPLSDSNLGRECLKPRGQFPSSKCNKFVNCWDNVPVEQFCPTGLAFNSAGFCDYVYNVDCKGRAFEVPPDQSLISTDIIAPPERFPKINGSIPVNRPPPSSSPDIIAPPERFPAHTPSVDTTPPIYIPLGSVPDDNLRKQCLGPRGLFPSKHCNKYVNCWDGFALEQDCPPGLLFSYKGYCDFDYNVNCNGRIITATTTQSPPINNQPDAIMKPRPPNFDIVTSATQPTYRPVTDSPLTLIPPTKKPPVINATLVSPIYIPQGSIPGNHLTKKCLKPRGQFLSDICNKYVNCWDGYAIEQDCPPGLLFSEKGYCDYPYNVNCKNRVVIGFIQPQLGQPSNPQIIIEPDKQQTLPPHFLTGTGTLLPPNIPVTQSPPTTTTLSYVPPATVDENLRKKCVGLRGQFPTESCHKYIDCWDEFAVERDCPPGLLFSQKGYCDFAENVACYNRTVIKASSDPSCPTPNGTFRDKSNCSRYYTCVQNTVALKYECPSGLHYNDVIGVCDYVYRVDCSREPFVHRPSLKTNSLQEVPAALMDAAAGCKPGQVYKLNPECTSAALCRNTVMEVIHCPAGLAYDIASDRCLPLQLARCQNV